MEFCAVYMVNTKSTCNSEFLIHSLQSVDDLECGRECSKLDTCDYFFVSSVGNVNCFLYTHDCHPLSMESHTEEGLLYADCEKDQLWRNIFFTIITFLFQVLDFLTDLNTCINTY